MLHQDFETRHPKELKNLGSFAYANQDMGLWCVCYYNDVTGESGVWKPGDPVPEPFLDPFQTHAAWNANFERDVYERVLVPRFGFPPTEIEQWVDPSAVSRYRGYPGGLKAAAMLLGDANTQKDDEGRALMLKMAKPRYLDKRGNPVWWDDPEDISRLIEYCQQDVVAEVAIHKKLGELPYHEQEIFWLDRRINERGVKIDTDAVERMIHLVEQQDRRANSRLRVITGGDVERVTDISGTLLWLDQRGVLLPNLSKQTVEKTLRDAKVLGSALDAEAQEVLQIRQDNAKTSTAKLKAMKNAVAEDGRIHGMFQYYGAHT